MKTAKCGKSELKRRQNGNNRFMYKLASTMGLLTRIFSGTREILMDSGKQLDMEG